MINKFEKQTDVTGLIIERETLHSDRGGVIKQSSILFGPDDIHARTAIYRLVCKQRLSGAVDAYLHGYTAEVCNVFERRFVLQDTPNAREHRKSEHTV
jgi:hypothetical protein